ncbi:hypothetical protein [Mesorhizobium sp. SP-1A]|uniref:hypothetical protein n=1 Tax=Mesorhizobium sp. SP-1A TaxID=3077840 RepID=UPI0028F71A38|nr:hypothetical protein [Mesorhizobium sp. SP-1A]
MRLSDCIEILARRCGVNRGRTAAIANRLQHAGMLPLADAKRTPPELTPDDAALLLIAILAEQGVGDAAARAAEYAAKTSPEGYRLGETITAIMRGQIPPGSFIVREGGVSATVNGEHVVFGAPAEDGFGRFLTTATCAAIVAEWNGAPPHRADVVRQLERILT